MDYRTNKRVPLGKLLISPGAQLYANRIGYCLDMYLAAHARGDWGNAVTEEEWRANDIALRTGVEVKSAYLLSSGKLLLINTDGGRYTTLVCLADELTEE